MASFNKVGSRELQNGNQGASSAQPAHPDSPLRKAGDASFSPSPAAFDTAAPMRDPSTKGRFRTGGTLNVASQIHGPHERPSLPAEVDPLLQARLDARRAISDGDQKGVAADSKRKSSVLGSALKGTLNLFGRERGQSKQTTSQIQSQHKETDQSDDESTEEDDFVVVSGNVPVGREAASRSQQSSYPTRTSDLPESSYVPAQATHADDAAFEGQAIMRRPMNLRSTIGYATDSFGANATHYRCTMSFDPEDMQAQLAQRPGYDLTHAQQQLSITVDELVDAVNRRVFQKNYGVHPEELEYSTLYKQDVQSDLDAIKLLLQQQECALSVICQKDHASFIGKIQITSAGGQRSLEWPRGYEFRGVESGYANDPADWGARFTKQQKCDGLFSVFQQELQAYQQAWAVVKSFA